MLLKSLIFSISLLGLLAGCTTTPTTSPQQQQKLANEIYADGHTALKNADYETAATHFKSLEIYYPEDPYTHQAQMELAYAYFKSGDYNQTIAITDRFIRLYPNTDNIDYAYYLKALASFEQTTATLSSDAKRDDSMLAAQTTLKYFEDLLILFPDSKYQEDAEQRVQALEEQLARHEVDMAKQLISQGDHANAVVHARTVVENYPHTTAAAEALTIVDMGYEIMAIDNSKPAPDKAMSEAAEPAMVETGMSNLPQIAGAMDGNWLLQQPADHYTLQLVSTLKKSPLEKYIARHQLQGKVAYFTKSIDGKTWHSLVYGSFASTAEAKAAINELPASIQNERPWVQNMQNIQQQIKAMTPR